MGMQHLVIYEYNGGDGRTRHRHPTGNAVEDLPTDCDALVAVWERKRLYGWRRGGGEE